MSRMPFMAGNWKMHFNIKESTDLANGIAKAVSGMDDREVVIAPVFTALASVTKAVSSSGIKIAAQNSFYEEKGAYTGEISNTMLKDAGCTYVILGHSERRTIFMEDDELINLKIKAAINSGLNPIFCIGETEKEYNKGLTFNIIERQITLGLSGICSNELSGLVLAYEPIWAIGTGLTATPAQAQDIHKLIRSLFEKKYNNEVAKDLRIIYGGSVKPSNVDQLMAQLDIDGVLVGGASLEVESFSRIAGFIKT